MSMETVLARFTVHVQGAVATGVKADFDVPIAHVVLRVRLHQPFFLSA